MVGVQLRPAAGRHQVQAFRQPEDSDAAGAWALGRVETDRTAGQQEPRRDEAGGEPGAELAGKGGSGWMRRASSDTGLRRATDRDLVAELPDLLVFVHIDRPVAA